MLALVVAAQLFSNGLAPIVTGEAGAPSSCEPCHAAEHAEWRASRHASAYTNPTFQREYAQRPDDWCVHCHAPLDAQLKAVRAGGTAPDGVTCAACHVRNGRILAATKREGSPHATDVRADFGGAAFCAGCHQFNFPILDDDAKDPRDRVTGYTSHPMQNTIVEHAAGPHASESCRTCHSSPAEHAYAGGHDPKMLERALQLDVCRDRADVVARVTNRGAGHRVPTGDVHRHLALRVWRPSAPEALHELLFVRRFEPTADGGKILVEDTGLAPLQSRSLRVPLRALGASSEPIAVELRFVYTSDEFPQRDIGEPAFTTVASVRATTLAPCARR